MPVKDVLGTKKVPVRMDSDSLHILFLNLGYDRISPVRSSHDSVKVTSIGYPCVGIDAFCFFRIAGRTGCSFARASDTGWNVKDSDSLSKLRIREGYHDATPFGPIRAGFRLQSPIQFRQETWWKKKDRGKGPRINREGPTTAADYGQPRGNGKG